MAGPGTEKTYLAALRPQLFRGDSPSNDSHKAQQIAALSLGGASFAPLNRSEPREGRIRFAQPHKSLITLENAITATFRILFGSAVAALLSIVVVPTKAHAQATGFQSAGAKITGDVYWPGRASGRYIESARNYAQEVQTYVAKAPKPEPSVVREIKTELGRYLSDAEKHLTAMKADFASDKETLAAVGMIEKELATAVSQNKAMIACCEDQKFDKIATMTCCTDLVKQLDKVHKEHVTLMQKLSSKYSGSPGTK